MSDGAGEVASRSLEDQIQRLKGVGPVRQKTLIAAGVQTVADLLAYLPRKHRVLPGVQPIQSCEPGQVVTLIGEIDSVLHRRSFRSRGGHLRVGLRTDNESVVLDFFNQGYLRNTLASGQKIRVTGILQNDGAWKLAPAHFQTGEQISQGQLILCDYRNLGGLKPGQLAALMRRSLEQYAEEIEDPLPPRLVQKHGFVSLATALTEVHAPSSPASLAASCRRLTYNAFLAGALAAEGEKSSLVGILAPAIVCSEADQARLTGVLPFRLTDGQLETLAEIFQDISTIKPMRRLIQGDVGCGKTAVAGMAALAVANCGKQVAMLAPTEVLARQLHQVVGDWAEALGFSAVLLVGKMKAKERRLARASLAEGKAHIAIGTHALFSKPVEFKELGLVVVDEQHRFGVLQRLRLVRKGQSPHLLAMSATPIPRTLAMTLYSDLAMSSIKQRPQGRKPIVTSHHVRDLHGPFDWRSLADCARLGEKCFIVFPGIESESESFPTLLDLGRKLAQRFFKGIPVAAVHGRMPDKDKQEKLQAFRSGAVKVLFATTVIEVGVDIPDARHMVIVGANRFGLAQLHQLRGRVGRGQLGGHCYLLTKTKKSADSERLALLVECDDGFDIAERDLELRGPGDMMGLKQHGPGPLTAAVEDENLLQAAFADAQELVEEGANLMALKETLGKFAWRRRSRSRNYVDAG